MAAFKNRNLTGFAFIEIMIAITLLSLFGTTLFLIQSNIFANVARTHIKVLNLIRAQSLRTTFYTKKMNLLQQKKSFAELKFDKEFKEPHMTIKIEVKKIPEASELYKKFTQSLLLVDQTITIQDKIFHNISFLYQPELKEEQPKERPKDDSQAASAKQAKQPPAKAKGIQT